MMDDGPSFVELSDGRRLAYAEYGDAQGKPILYCHGYPSSRREALLLHDTAASLGARIISPDRPGYGDSDAQAHRTITDWPADVASLADALGLDRVALLGVSGGGPYALACAWGLPERLSELAIVCPLGPIYLPHLLHDMNWAARANLGLARHAPHLARLVFGHAAGGFLSFWPRSVEHFRSIAASDADRDTLQDANTRQVLNQTVRDAVRDGAQGALQDLFLYTREWGIPMDEIAPRVQIWHGMDDGTVPVSHSRWYAQHLPHGDLRLFPGEGHFSLPLRYAAEILQGLMDT